MWFYMRWAGKGHSHASPCAVASSAKGRWIDESRCEHKQGYSASKIPPVQIMRLQVQHAMGWGGGCAGATPGPRATNGIRGLRAGSGHSKAGWSCTVLGSHSFGAWDSPIIWRRGPPLF